ncbi:MAG TPA: amino acid permease [Myxococcaceae bacterium]|nr:amino acid permease [Myxococcaceae bacterium]
MSSRAEEVTGGARDAWGERLPRKLGLLSAIAFLISSIIGAGIFRVPATVAGQLGEPGPILFLWVVGAAITLCGALSLAELAAAFPRSGGLFTFMLQAYGPVPAFVYGWAELTVIAPASMAAVATIFAEYLGYFLPLGSASMRWISAGALLAVGLLNYFSVRLSAAVNNLATLAKYGGLAALGILAFAVGRGDIGHFSPAWSGAVRTSLMATALVSVLFTYDGWVDLLRVAGEVRRPERNLPRALIWGSVLIAVIYVGMNAAYIYLVPVDQMAGAKLVAASAAERIPLLGSRGAALIAALVVISCFGNIAAAAMSMPRTQFAMAERGYSFGALARISPRFQTPSAAIAIITALAMLYALIGTFQQLAARFILGLWPFYALDVAAVFVLRRRRPDLPRPYRVWGYPAVPAFFLLGSAALIVNALWTEPLDTGITFAIIFAGLPAYWLWRKLFHRSAAAELAS